MLLDTLEAVAGEHLWLQIPTCLFLSLVEEAVVVLWTTVLVTTNILQEALMEQRVKMVPLAETMHVQT